MVFTNSKSIEKEFYKKYKFDMNKFLQVGSGNLKIFSEN